MSTSKKRHVAKRVTWSIYFEKGRRRSDEGPFDTKTEAVEFASNEAGLPWSVRKTGSKYSTSDPHGDSRGLFTAAEKKKALAPAPKAPAANLSKADVARATAFGIAAGEATVDETNKGEFGGVIGVERLDRTHLDWKAGTAFANTAMPRAYYPTFSQAFMRAADKRITEILGRTSKNFTWPPR